MGRICWQVFFTKVEPKMTLLKTDMPFSCILAFYCMALYLQPIAWDGSRLEFIVLLFDELICTKLGIGRLNSSLKYLGS